MREISIFCKAETGVSAGAALLLSQLGDHVCEREAAAGQS